MKSLDELGGRASAVLTVAPVAGVRVRVLGIDPGSRRTGFGVIDANGSQLAYVASGTIAVTDGEFTHRLRTIFERMRALISQYQPAEVAVERVFVSKNADSALKLGQARGAALCAVLNGDTRISEYAPRAVKRALVGYGAAEKTQVAWMVRQTLAFDGRLTADAADALALAICHAQHLNMNRRVVR